MVTEGQRKLLAAQLRVWATDVERGLPIISIEQYREPGQCETILVFRARMPDTYLVAKEPG